MAIFDWMADLAIDSAGGQDKVFGTKPKVADFTPTDLATEQQRAIDTNVSNSADLDRMLNSIIPGYTDMQAQGTKNTLSELRGEIPMDVQDKIRRDSAFQSLIGGYAGSGMSRALTARDLGRTSLDLTQMGENSAQKWTSMARETAAPWLISSAQQAASTTANNLGTQNQEQYQFNVDAAPDPGAAGKFNTIATIGGAAASFGGMAAKSSDVRLKENIVSVGTSPRGIREVEFTYRDDPHARVYRGAIAQEVQEIAPEAVTRDVEGFLAVFYDLIDVDFVEVARA